MEPCAMCGNEYDKAFVVEIGGERYTFDSFECAIATCAPTCGHCSCRIIGHGVEVGTSMYCCAHCAEAVGATGVVDRAG